MSDAFFRAGVGAVVIDERRRILVLRRNGARDGKWQLPQGGIGFDEEPFDAFYRELNEETGLLSVDIALLDSVGEWWVDEVPVEYRNAKVGWGQAHRWFLCRLLVSHEAVRPDHAEFDRADWVTTDKLLARAIEFRVPVYRRLITQFGL